MAKSTNTVRCSEQTFASVVAIALAEGVKRGKPVTYQEIIDEAVEHYRGKLKI